MKLHSQKLLKHNITCVFSCITLKSQKKHNILSLFHAKEYKITHKFNFATKKFPDKWLSREETRGLNRFNIMIFMLSLKNFFFLSKKKVKQDVVEMWRAPSWKSILCRNFLFIVNHEGEIIFGCFKNQWEIQYLSWFYLSTQK